MRGSMRAAVLVAILVLGTAASALAQPLFSGGHDPAAGARTFDEKRCVACHAVNGKGGKLGPDLARVARPRTFYDLGAALWNHAPRMASRMRQLGIARPLLTPLESGNVAAYLYTLSYFDRPGNTTLGRRLFTDKQCVACHRVGNVGGAVGPRLDALKIYASPIALAAAMWNHGPEMAAVMESRGIERPTFTSVELTDLIAFINKASPMPPGGRIYVLPGRPAEGARVLTEKQCFACHSASGKDGGELNLAEREAHQSLTGFAAAMWNKIPRMTAALKERNVTVPKLRPDDMADIVAYLYAVRYFAESGDPRNGVILATYKGCLGCHGLYGERDKPASDLTQAPSLGNPPAAIAALWNHAFISDPRPPQNRAPWPTFTGREMADLLTYLRSLKRPP